MSLADRRAERNRAQFIRLYGASPATVERAMSLPKNQATLVLDAIKALLAIHTASSKPIVFTDDVAYQARIEAIGAAVSTAAELKKAETLPLITELLKALVAHTVTYPDWHFGCGSRGKSLTASIKAITRTMGPRFMVSDAPGALGWLVRDTKVTSRAWTFETQVQAVEVAKTMNALAEADTLK